MCNHSLMTSLLKFSQIIPLVTKRTVAKAVTAVPVTLARTGIFREWHQATFATFMHIDNDTPTIETNKIAIHFKSSQTNIQKVIIIHAVSYSEVSNA